MAGPLEGVVEIPLKVFGVECITHDKRIGVVLGHQIPAAELQALLDDGYTLFLRKRREP